MNGTAAYWKTRRQRRWPVRAVFLGLMIIIGLFPILWTAVAASGIEIDSTVTPPAWSGQPSLEHYVEIGVAEPAFGQEVANSTLTALSTALLTVSVAFLAAYGFARARFRGKNLVVQGFLVLASLPVISFLIPLQNSLRNLHLTDTLTGITLAESALFLPLATYVLYGYLSRLAADLEEAARLDGGTTLDILVRVVLPLAAPGLAATGIIVFVLSWNQLLVPLVLTARLKTIPTALIDFFTFEREMEWPTAAAALLASLVPIAILVGAMHRLLERFSLGISAQDDL